MLESTVSYARGVDYNWQTVVIKGIELLTGARKVNRLYRDAAEAVRRGEDVWKAALDGLGVHLQLYGASLHNAPKTGPLIVIANHPFGLIDGLAICYLVSRFRSDYKIMINQVLEQVPEIRPYLLPVDFRSTKEAKQTNFRSGDRAKESLQAGGTVIIFPAGGIATSPKMFDRAVDLEWKSFLGKMVLQTGAAVLPIYFSGQNSRLFQVASHLSMTLRLGLLLKEVCNRIDRPLDVVVGETIEHAELTKFEDRKAMVAHLRAVTYALAAKIKN
jgi:putative hemolysin